MKQILSVAFLVMLWAGPVAAQSRLSGYVISIDTGEPVANAWIMLKDAAGMDVQGLPPARTGDNGFFEMHGIGAGQYSVHASTIFVLRADSVGVYVASSDLEVGASDVEAHFGFSRAHATYSRAWRQIESPSDLANVQQMMLRPRIRDGRGAEIPVRMVSVETLNP